MEKLGEIGKNTREISNTEALIRCINFYPMKEKTPSNQREIALFNDAEAIIQTLNFYNGVILELN